MVIFKGDGCLLSSESTINKINPNGIIPSLKTYVDMLNDEYSTEVPINKKGYLTTKEVKGSFIQQKDNKFGIIIGSEFNPVVYRGLNNDYCFMPTSLRYELFDGKERVRHSIEWIKKAEFQNLIKKTDYFKKSKEFKVLEYSYEIDLESVAKLYNFVSDCIDITRNIFVAYFYAYTYVDKEKNQVLPITNFDINSPTLYVGNLKKLYYNTPDALNNFSFQPFIRAKVQQSMSINTNDNYEHIKNQFIKIDLPKSPEIAEYVYNMFDGGKVLFPGDYAAKYAVQIKSSKNLQAKLFEEYCEKTSTDKKWLKEQLIQEGYTITNSVIDINQEANYIINREIDEIIIPYIDSSIILRKY